MSTATRPSPTPLRADPAQIADWLRLFAAPDQVVEVRILKSGKSGTVSGYFDDLDKAAKAATFWSGKAPGCYFTMNPVDPALLARANNRMVERAINTTTDADIIRRCWMLVDFDPRRPAGISSTDHEHEAAIERARQCRDWLCGGGWPSPILADSGNGAHLLYAIDLANDPEATDLLKRCLRAMAARFSDDRVEVDTSTFNVARICKVYGTLSCKGDSTTDRPHRLAKVLEVPDLLTAVPLDLLQALAAEVQETPRPAPNHHHDMPMSRVQRRAAAYLTRIPGAVSGQHGHDATFHVSCVLVKGFGLTVDEAMPVLAGWNRTCEPPWTEKDLLHKLEDAIKQPGEPGHLLHEPPTRNGTSTSCGPRNGQAHHDPGRNGQARGTTPQAATPAADGDEHHLTDRGNARRVVDRHGADLRYVYLTREWRTWDGCRWKPDDTGEVERRIKDTEQHLYRQTAAAIQGLDQEALDADERKRRLNHLTTIAKHCLRWESARGINDCLAVMRSESEIAATADQFDHDPYLLNLLNGTLDLRTGTMREHRRGDCISKLAPVAYDATATCPRWMEFLHRIMAGNTNMVAYLQRVVGHGLTGDTSEQCVWVLHGAGANGKSTFLGTILAMLGDYGCQAVSELLLARQHEQHPTERADLLGKRLVATIEVDEGKRLAESLLKQLSGGDKIRARRMRQDFFEFEPEFKLLLAANHKPQVRGCDAALWRRIKLVPFTVTIAEPDRDKHLLDKLKAEMSGILNWALRGCLAWQRHGMDEPAEVRAATEAYKIDQDAVGRFLAERCFLHPEARIRAAALLEAFQSWSGDKGMTHRLFADRLRAHGYTSKVGTGGYTYWIGIGLPDV